MKIRSIAFLSLLISGLTTTAFIQTIPKELVGTWTIVSITRETDGKVTDLYGPNPQGRRMVDADGHFSYIITRADLPKITSNNRATATLEEYKAIVQGSLAFFGTVTVNEAEKTYTIHTEVCTNPNWVGLDRKVSYTIDGDELTTISADASVDYKPVRVVFKRVK